MKIKRKTFVGGILAALCACAALTFGAVFSLSDNGKVNVEAATSDVAPDSCVKFVCDEVKFWSGSNLSGGSNNDIYSSMTTSNSNVTLSQTFAGNSTAILSPSLKKVAIQRIVAVQFHAEITVPAGATYKIKYDSAGSMTRSPNSSAGRSTVLSYCGDNSSALSTAKFNDGGSPITGSNLIYYFDGSATHGLVSSKEVTFTNTDTTDKIFKDYFVFGVGSRAYASGDVVTGTLTMTATAVIEEQINKPENLSTAYDGQSHWLDSFSDSWIESYHTDINATEVKNISYVPSTGGEAQDLGTDTTKIKDAGIYTVTMGLTGGMRWSDETTDEKTFTITINRAKPNVTAAFMNTLPNPLYISYNGGKLPELKNDASNPTAGTIEWQSGEKPTEGTTVYYWQFTPDDTVNYLPITGKSAETQINVPYKQQGVKNLELTLNQVDGVPVNIYDAFTLGDGDYSVKKYITVNAVKEDGITKVPLQDGEYTLELDDGSDKLSEGSVTLVAINDDGKSGTLNITVLKSEVKALLVTYKDNGTHLKYSEKLSVDDIKKNLTVRAQWNYSGDDYVEVTDKTQYTITGDIKAGSPITLTVNYNGIPKDFKPIIDKGDYNIDDSLFADKTVGFTGTAFDTDGWIDTTKLPTGMTVTYLCSTDLTTVGEHIVTASFSNPDPDNYNDPADKTAKLTISALPVYDMTGVELEGSTGVSGDRTNGFTARYDGNDVEISVDATTLKGDLSGVSVDTVTYEKKQADGSWAVITGKPNGAGEYRVTVSFTGSADHAAPDSVKANLTIAKADYDMTGVAFGAKNITFTGSAFNPEGWIDTTQLPQGMTVSYTYTTDLTSIGEHVVTATFSNPDSDNYNDPADMNATLTISDAVVTGVSAKLEDGSKFDANSTLDDLKAKLSAKIEYNNETKEEVKVEDLIITCEGLQENGKLEVGSQTITIKYTAEDGTEHTTTVTVTVEKAKVALPVYKGTLSYTGAELKPTANDFDGYNAEIMSFVESKTVAGMNAGTYKAVFALNDPDRYEWASATTLKKALYAVVVYDGEVTLEANEAAVEWNIAKAVITATKAQGKLPVFASESYKGSFDGIFSYEYFTDKECQNKVDGDKLAANSTYYVRTKLEDTSNFELDETATEITTEAFEYATPQTLWGKIVKFLTVNWLWIVIAVAALILLITIIALAARASKNKKRRLAEEKAEKLAREEREREERRLEREERMARMNQQQAMPQMMMPQMMPQMQMPQPQPQYAPQPMPQQVQPMTMPVGGGNNSSEIAELKAEISALRAEQNAAKEVAALRVEVMKAEQNAVLRSDVNALRGDNSAAGSGQVMAGMTAATLVEMVTAAMEKVLDSRDKTVVQQTAEKPESVAASAAATQVPPDAVMTTVTTTKIDTTKKPVQNVQGTTRPVVRNYVAPMPVDDGRVFDVGGFYKPADPLTDLNLDEEEKKD